MIDAARAEFILTVRQAVRAVAPGTPAAVVDLITAHAGYESGFGTAPPFKIGNNLFNLTRVSSDPLPVVIGKDLEYGPTGAAKSIQQRFAAYASPLESVSHYFRFLGSPRYESAKADLLTGSLSFLEKLRAGGYFTLPLEKYQSGFMDALRTVQSVPDPYASIATAATKGPNVAGWVVLAGAVLAGAALFYFRGGA